MEKRFEQRTVAIQSSLNWILILWNDDVNDMMDVSDALRRISKLSTRKSMSIMMEAHRNGQAFVREGSEQRMMTMHRQFGEIGISTSVVREFLN